MTQPIFRHTKVEKKIQGSNVRFQGNFKKTLATLIERFEADLLTHSLLVASVIDTVPGNNNIKIWFRSGEYESDKIVNIVFRYHHEDEWYGHVHVEAILSELSQKPKSTFLGKYALKEYVHIRDDLFTLLLSVAS